MKKNLLLNPVLILITILCNPVSSNACVKIGAGSLHSMALCSDSTVWTWGSNLSGQLGDNTTTAKWTPVQVTGLTGITSIAAGAHHSLSLRTDSTVWTWGNNFNGQLGDNTISNKKTPVQVHGPNNVGFLTGITAISAGSVSHSLALRYDGTVWNWGKNGYGELGDNTTTEKHTPVQVHGLNNVGFLTGITAIASGSTHSLALKNDGTVWGWGNNWSGQLGVSASAPKHTPVQTQGLTGIIAIAAGSFHSLALKNGGTVWAYGGNSSGQLGDNTTTYTSTPVQVHGPNNVGFLTGVTTIAVGGEGTGWSYSLALKNDSTVWAWGYNGDGQLGDNTTTTRLTPVQVHGPNNVGFLTGITQITAGDRHSLAWRQDGTVWAWGENSKGQLGDSTITTRLTPVQVSKLCPVVLCTPPTVVMSSDVTICNGASAILNAAGSVTAAPYAYAWTPAGSLNDPNISNPVASPTVITTYTCVVTDGTACTNTGNVTVTVNPVFSLSANSTNASCATCSDGTASAAPSGGMPGYAYSWLPGGQTTQTATGLVPGAYTVCVTDANGCMVCDSVTVTFSTGINESSSSGFISVYPNPGDGKFMLEISGTNYQVSSFEIYNVLGKKIYQSTNLPINQSENFQIDLSSHPGGIYFLAIKTEQGATNQKLIINH